MNYYAEAFRIAGSLTDVKMDFLSIQPVADANGQITSEQQVLDHRIIMSLPLAKEFATKILQLIADHESVHGPILDLEEARSRISPEM